MSRTAFARAPHVVNTSVRGIASATAVPGCRIHIEFVRKPPRSLASLDHRNLSRIGQPIGACTSGQNISATWPAAVCDKATGLKPRERVDQAAGSGKNFRDLPAVVRQAVGVHSIGSSGIQCVRRTFFGVDRPGGGRTFQIQDARSGHRPTRS